MGAAEEEREPLVAPTVPEGLPKAQPTGHIAMAVPELSRTSQRSWDGNLLACCGRCDADGVSTFAYVKYCTPFAWGHNMKRAFNASFWKHAIIFALLFGAWWWLYVGFATQAGFACGPPPPHPQEPWHTKPLPAEPFTGEKMPAVDQTFLAGATWQPEKFKPQEQEQKPDSGEPAPLNLIDIAEPVDVKQPATTQPNAEDAAAKQAEETAAAAKKQAEEAAAAAQKHAQELSQKAQQEVGDAQKQATQQAQQAQATADQLAKDAQQQSQQALKTLQEQFNHQLDLTPGKDQLETQLQLAKKVVADGMAQLNAQLGVSGRKLLHKHDDEDEHDDHDHKKHHKEKKAKKEKKEKKEKGKHKEKHDKGHHHDHPGPEEHPGFGPDSPGCKAAQSSMMVMWGIASIGALIGAWYAARMRTAIRERYGIPGSRMKDCLAWLFCGPCALCQETRTLHANNVHSGVWFGPTMLGAPAHPLQAPNQQAVHGKPVKGQEEVDAKV